MDFVPSILKTTASYFGKTDSSLKFIFLQQIETHLIYGSMLASFCQHCSCFLVTEFCMFFGMVFLWYVLDLGTQMACKSQRRGHSILFLARLFNMCATLFRKGIFESSLARFGSLLVCFLASCWLPVGFVLVTFWLVLTFFCLPWLV